ncbi:membrane protein [Thermocatellispora tengchongensis]|uniref:Membrane protein n=1 Tax=Thermocatellispora tengchongensis TaxID=1073253 RepID=A0A840P9Y9_9ACTN|nr:YihY/virulence factor BrkB family protein [Thermocatellispora tengchongensis]MBB5134671.1 membrane protein [Thermocatellispora tengchongensis]
MGRLLARLQRFAGARKERGRAAVGRARIRWPWLDHVLRTVQRYQVQSGDRLAGAVTYFAFLSFFPIIALAFALFGYIVTVRPDALETLQAAINEQLPGLADKLRLQELSKARVGAGILGLLGLLYAGLGAVDALRGALREISMTTEPPLNFFLGKLRDLVALVLIGLTAVLSVAVGGFATGATGTVAGWLGLSHSVVGQTGVWLVGLAVSLGADMLVFLIVLGWLARATQPFRAVLGGALIAAVGLQVLKQLATLILAGTLNNPVYGTFAVIAGLLLWINLATRVTLYAAAWTATATLGPPPEPTPLPAVHGSPSGARAS